MMVFIPPSIIQQYYLKSESQIRIFFLLYLLFVSYVFVEGSQYSRSNLNIFDNLGKLPNINVKEQANRQSRIAVVVDVGSTGSRAHSFEWIYDPIGCNGTGAVKIVLPEKSSKIRPGLSTYLDIKKKAYYSKVGHQHITAKNITTGVSYPSSSFIFNYVIEYLQLIKLEVDNLVPEKLRRNTFVWILGTAGMRHFSKVEKKTILDIIRRQLRDTWEYKTHSEWVQVLDGDKEGLYSWVLLNQLLGRPIGPHSPYENLILKTGYPPAPFIFSKNSLSPSLKPAALVELGGASAQVVLQHSDHSSSQYTSAPERVRNSRYESVFPVPGKRDFVYLNFCGATVELYAKSFQGFGRQLAFQRFLNMNPNRLIQEQLNNSSIVSTLMPCLPPDVVFPYIESLKDMVAVEDIGEPLEKYAANNTNQPNSLNDGILGIPNGTFAACRDAVIGTLFSKDDNGKNVTNSTISSHLSWAPLPFNLDNDVQITGNENLYFFHKLVSEPEFGDNAQFSIRGFRKRAKLLCAAKSVNIVKNLIHPKAEFEKAKTGCFGLTFMAEFLSNVLQVKEDRPLYALRMVEHIEIAWPAGHILVELPFILRSFPELLYSSNTPDNVTVNYHDEL